MEKVFYKRDNRYFNLNNFAPGDIILDLKTKVAYKIITKYIGFHKDFFILTRDLKRDYECKTYFGVDIGFLKYLEERYDINSDFYFVFKNPNKNEIDSVPLRRTLIEKVTKDKTERY